MLLDCISSSINFKIFLARGHAPRPPRMSMLSVLRTLCTFLIISKYISIIYRGLTCSFCPRPPDSLGSPAADNHISVIVSRGQTSISAQGVYRLQYKRPCRKGSGLVHSAYLSWHPAWWCWVLICLTSLLNPI